VRLSRQPSGRSADLDAGDLGEEISRLEVHIEELAKGVERCRKIILIAKIAIAAGGILMVALVIGAIKFSPVALISAMAAAIGGIVVFGSNASTAKQTAANMKAAEELRAELIGRIDLRVVEAPERGLSVIHRS
jgi:hypothetical protein